jgi:hypothetical protein
VDDPAEPPPAAPPPAEIVERPDYLELRISRLSDELLAVRGEVEALKPPRRRFPIGTMLGALLAFVAPLIGVFVWWHWLDPIAPRITVEHSEIHDRTPPGVRGGRGLFEVVRVVTSDRTAPCSVHAFFERSDSGGAGSFQGRPVVRDRTTFAIAPASTMVEEGTHRRDRLWEVPQGLPGGNWIYRSHLRFCNPLRCVDMPLPSLPVTFE